ncbi:uncharacterized protein LOC112562853 [Pomacea canaliculata]|uniref:uncharacterized protein LOC112562853 n=1 Tax=Pomacea canaliculata TaxID=400727 RepID=UPI000D72D0B6|nr:uncharacterized protein LOC112562853 [Pomacea canaliculata]
MACKVPKIPVCVAIVCCVVALIFQLVAVVGTGWLVFSRGDRGGELGLFRSCINGMCADVPSSLMPDYWRVCQAYSILGLLTIAGSLVAGILHSVFEDTAKVSVAAIASCVASVLFLIIELVMFGLESSSLRHETGLDFGYGFILSIIACILSFLATLGFAVGSRMS